MNRTNVNIIRSISCIIMSDLAPLYEIFVIGRKKNLKNFAVMIFGPCVYVKIICQVIKLM